MRIVIKSDEAGIVSLASDFLGREFDDGEGEAFRGAEIVAPFVVTHAEDWGVGC